MKSKVLFISAAMLVMILFISFSVSCRKEEPADRDEGRETAGTAEESPQDDEKEIASVEDDEAAGPAEEDSQEPEEEPVQEEDEEEAGIPEDDITAKVDEADSLFADGMYAEASQAYRNAEIAIEGSELPDETKAGLLAQIGPSQSQAKDIVDAARMHHSNAMTLIYEKRYEEAEAELNAALDIYPKYQTAIDALESLEDIKGLQ